VNGKTLEGEEIKSNTQGKHIPYTQSHAIIIINIITHIIFIERQTTKRKIHFSLSFTFSLPFSLSHSFSRSVIQVSLHIQQQQQQHNSIKRITANIKFLNLPPGVPSHRSLSAHFDDNIFSLV
jgi:hypothetical protein